MALALGLALAAASPAAAQSLVIGELMYHPVDQTSPLVDGDEFEFVELWNAGASSFNLTGAQFTQGITYTFGSTVLAAGARVVVTRNRTAFFARYPAASNVAAGAYSGALNNAGETVTLKSSGGATLFSVTYGDSGGWSERADGLGASLVFTNRFADPDLPASWGPSDSLHGAPGQADAAAQPDVVLNELLTHTDPPLVDAIELRNLAADPVSVNGWYLSDDVAVRNKYRITNAAAIPPGGHAVVYATAFADSNNPAITPFSLSELGESVFLTAGDAASNLTRFADYAAFGAADNGVSFGRYPDGAGEWAPMAARTLGASNGLPAVGPVVIGEIMYHPVNDSADQEYIELLNTASSNVPLFNPAFPTDTWSLASAVSYALPTNTWLAPGARLLLTGATNAAAFRAAYNLAPSVPVLGPWTGRLDNAGETIELRRPGDPETNLVPAVVIERVAYGDAAPWPAAADGKGPSLERLDPLAYANSPSNWFAGPPGGSPGAAPAAGLVQPGLAPAAPAPGQSITVTVSVVAQALPTSVVVRATTGGVATAWAMRDDGLGGDAAAGDQVYTAVLTAPPTGTWFYYQYEASSTGGAVRLPADETEFEPAPALTVRLSGGGLQTTVQPVAEWTTWTASGLATHTQLLYVYLNEAGEAMLDDLSVRDAATQTERVLNGGFAAPLAPPWRTNGNHAASFRETLAGEAGNGALHLAAGGPGSSFANSVNTDLSPPLAAGQPVELSFRVRRASSVKERWFWVAIGSPPADVAISELMYHPAGTNDEAGEYVELVNPAPEAADIGGLELKGAKFVFAAGASLGPGAFAVCGASTGVLAAVHGVTNAAGPWLGALQNSGETLRLVNRFGRELDRVPYNDKDPWPAAADGYGPSLERVSWAVPGSNAWNWVASGTPTNWQQAAWTGLIDSAGAALAFFLDYDGKCWIDDVSVAAATGGPQLVANGAFEGGLAGWTATGNHARARVEAGAGYGGSAGLAVAGTFSRYTYPESSVRLVIGYGDAVSNAVRSTALGAATDTLYAVSFRYRRDGLSSNLCWSVGGATNRLALGSDGSPGRAGYVPPDAGTIGVSEAFHLSNIVTAAEANAVFARVGPGTPAAVELLWRAVPTNGYEFTDIHVSRLAMSDDGVAPDETAGDGWYAARLPATGTNATLVRYRVRAVATNGATALYPRLDDPGADRAYWACSGLAPASLPSWHLLVDASPVAFPVAARGCAVSPDGQTFTDITVRHRGGAFESTPPRSGLAVRFHRNRLLDAWFANDQDGINFRHRGNDSAFHARRIVAEPLAYDLQRLLGLATPRFRYVCVRVNGEPTVTTELEDPQEAFLAGNGLDPDDYVVRVGNSGDDRVGDGPAYDDNAMTAALAAAPGPAKAEAVRTNLWYESVRTSLGLLALAGNADQNFFWNMFQHRRAEDGLWAQYPWDTDMSFVPDALYNPPTTNLHPYYATPAHYSLITGQTNGAHLARALFDPESGPDSAYTLPYRYRQQMTLWRHCSTMLTTNFLYPRLDAIRNGLAPAFSELGLSDWALTTAVANAKAYIPARRHYLMEEAWSDKSSAVWAQAPYDPSRVVINELMIDPASGGEYIELYNAGTQDVDLGWWELACGEESYRLPHGAIAGPTSYLVVADAEWALTNAYAELAVPGRLQRRYASLPLWDSPIAWTTATEYATRVVEIPSITLLNAGATIRLWDTRSNLVDTVTYTNGPPWPWTNGVSLELIDPALDNADPASWQLCSVTGTPGSPNSASWDRDGDGMADAWERLIAAASGGALTNPADVLAGADFDGDGLTNGAEYAFGSDPVTPDATGVLIRIGLTNAVPEVSLPTRAPAGIGYEFIRARLYTLQGREALDGAGWTNTPPFVDSEGTGAPLVLTNHPGPAGFYRGAVRLAPWR